MIYKTFRRVFLGVGLLTTLAAGAQEFDSELQLSNDETVYWYRICSAVPEMEGYAMTDPASLTAEVSSNMIHLLPTENEDSRSQWKLTAGEDGRIILTNRSTGNQVSNRSFDFGNNNFTWLTFSSDAPGFTVTSLGDNAFKLESVEDDGVSRCLALADKDGEALTYPESGESTSVIGWKFFPVEIEDAIGSMKGNSTTIRVKGKRIFVSGCSEWQLFNTAGEEMPRTVSLATGVYMVKMPQKTIKVLIP